MGAYIAFTIISAFALVALIAFIVYKWIKEWDKQSLYFLCLIAVCLLVIFIGCALGWAKVI